MSLAIALLVGLAIPVLHYYKNHVTDWPRELLGHTLFGLGLAHLLLLPTLASLLFGADEYRLWVLQGPRPFNLLGSGPLLVWLGTYLSLAGYGLIALSLRARQVLSRDRCQ